LRTLAFLAGVAATVMFALTLLHHIA
jgi:hypothetical protein